MTEKKQQPVTPEIPTEAADKPESDNPPKNENRRGANQTERERTIAQNRQRLREIVDVVRKHDILHGITPEKLCAIIEDLGPTFIKLGQILSMRSDILPRDYCEALKKLRSNVSPMPFEQVQRVVETSYGCPMEEVFASFDEKALGSASIAQAHAAILKSGERVVVKVQREGIHEVMSRDIILLKQACKVLKYTPAGSLVDFNQVLDEMWVVAQEEMNFQTEAANLERFHALNQDVVFVTSPILYRAYTTTNVLVMERIDGMGIDEHDKLVEAGYDLAEIGAKLADNYVRQIMEDGFFHADPHPGNIIIRGGQIVLIDLGMTGRLDQRTRAVLKEMIFAVAKQDSPALAEGLLRFAGTEADPEDYPALLADLDVIVKEFGTVDLAELDIAAFLTALTQMAGRHNIEVPSTVTTVGRALVTLEGLLDEFIPDVNMIEIISDHIATSKSLKNATKDEIKSLGVEGHQALHATLGTMTELKTVARMLTRGQLRVNMELVGSEEPFQLLSDMVNRLTMALIVVGLFVGSSIVYYAGMKPIIFGIPVIGFMGYVVAFALGVWIVIDIYLKGRKTKKR